MDPDSTTIFYRYLTLEEILTYFKNNKNLRDKIISRNYSCLPELEDEIMFGNFKTVKYLMEEIKIDPKFWTIEYVDENGGTEVIKYSFRNNITPSSWAIDWASYNGHLKIVKYLYKSGINPSSETINFATENGHLEIIKYLVKKGIRPTPWAINCASTGGHFAVVKYLKDKIHY